MRIKKFNSDLEGMTKRQCFARAKKEVKDLMVIYKPSTVRSYLTHYRKSLTDDKLFITKKLLINKGAQTALDKDYKKTLAKRQKSLIPIHDINAMIKEAIELLDSEKPYLKAAALCLLTGRRITEILKTAKFKSVKNDKNMILFSGQLKAKGLKGEYPIYILGNCKTKILKALRSIRGSVKTRKMTNDQVDNKYNQVVNQTISRIFSRFVGRKDIDYVTAHDLRNIYVLQASKLYKEDNQTLNSFISDMLGHGKDDVTTANSYQKYYIR